MASVGRDSPWPLGEGEGVAVWVVVGDGECGGLAEVEGEGLAVAVGEDDGNPVAMQNV